MLDKSLHVKFGNKKNFKTQTILNDFNDMQIKKLFTLAS